MPASVGCPNACRRLEAQLQELSQPSDKFPKVTFKTVYARRRGYQYWVGCPASRVLPHRLVLLPYYCACSR